MIETWIDALAKIWMFDDGQGKLVKSYRLFDKSDRIPESITEFPCAISYPTGLQPQYGASIPTILIWDGATEFHLAGDVQLNNIPYALPFFRKILSAAAGNIKLAGTVSEFSIPFEPGALSLVEFEYGAGPSHRGILVHWRVKEDVSGQITISA